MPRVRQRSDVLSCLIILCKVYSLVETRLNILYFISFVAEDISDAVYKQDDSNRNSFETEYCLVPDFRLPIGWIKGKIQRQSGISKGKWDVFIMRYCTTSFL